MSRPNHPTRPVTILAALTGLMLTLPAAKNGCGSLENTETLLSPVQAVTTVLEHDDGTVTAELVLISTSVNPHQFVDSAKDVTLRVPGGDEIELSLAESGHYTADSQIHPQLVYTPGETYQTSFELDDEAAADDVAGGNFTGVVDAPDDQVSFTLAEPPEFAGDVARIEWSPTSRYGLIRIFHMDTETVTYSNFDFDESQFDGSKWARLTKGGSKELSVDSFPESGNYIVSFCAVDAVRDFDTSLSAELGALSGFLIGRCAEDLQVAVQ
jgi:hypothetical protein